jgi:hypothetical protein
LLLPASLIRLAEAVPELRRRKSQILQLHIQWAFIKQTPMHSTRLI